MSAAAADNNNNNNGNICANCGKGEEEGTNNLKNCAACLSVKYCSRECQIAHWSQHKKECKKRAAELHDEKLFKQPPPEHGDCPICILRLPLLDSGRRYYTCCGKVVCSGCVHAPVYDDKGNVVTEKSCPFCRTPNPKSKEEAHSRANKRVDCGDAMAIYNLALANYTYGDRDYTKALELYQRAAELGYTVAYFNVGCIYDGGLGVKQDEKKAKHYFELAAMGGCMLSRHNLGIDEENAGNYERALKHYMISVRGGAKNSLDNIQDLYKNGHAALDDFMKALESYRAYLDEIKSGQRDEAAAARDDYKYY